MEYWLQSVPCYGSGGIDRAPNQAARFELILAKEETENTTVADGTKDTL